MPFCHSPILAYPKCFKFDWIRFRHECPFSPHQSHSPLYSPKVGMRDNPDIHLSAFIISFTIRIRNNTSVNQDSNVLSTILSHTNLDQMVRHQKSDTSALIHQISPSPHPLQGSRSVSITIRMPLCHSPILAYPKRFEIDWIVLLRLRQSCPFSAIHSHSPLID